MSKSSVISEHLDHALVRFGGDHIAAAAYVMIKEEQQEEEDMHASPKYQPPGKEQGELKTRGVVKPSLQQLAARTFIQEAQKEVNRRVGPRGRRAWGPQYHKKQMRSVLESSITGSDFPDESDPRNAFYVLARASPEVFYSAYLATRPGIGTTGHAPVSWTPDRLEYVEDRQNAVLEHAQIADEFNILWYYFKAVIGENQRPTGLTVTMFHDTVRSTFHAFRARVFTQGEHNWFYLARFPVFAWADYKAVVPQGVNVNLKEISEATDGSYIDFDDTYNLTTDPFRQSGRLRRFEVARYDSKVIDIGSPEHGHGFGAVEDVRAIHHDLTVLFAQMLSFTYNTNLAVSANPFNLVMNSLGDDTVGRLQGEVRANPLKRNILRGFGCFNDFTHVQPVVSLTRNWDSEPFLNVLFQQYVSKLVLEIAGRMGDSVNRRGGMRFLDNAETIPDKTSLVSQRQKTIYWFWSFVKDNLTSPSERPIDNEFWVQLRKASTFEYIFYEQRSRTVDEWITGDEWDVVNFPTGGPVLHDYHAYVFSIRFVSLTEDKKEHYYFLDPKAPLSHIFRQMMDAIDLYQEKGGKISQAAFTFDFFLDSVKYLLVQGVGKLHYTFEYFESLEDRWYFFGQQADARLEDFVAAERAILAEQKRDHEFFREFLNRQIRRAAKANSHTTYFEEFEEMLDRFEEQYTEDEAHMVELVQARIFRTAEEAPGPVQLMERILKANRTRMQKLAALKKHRDRAALSTLYPDSEIFFLNEPIGVALDDILPTSVWV